MENMVEIGGEKIAKKPERKLTELTQDKFLKLEEGEEIEVRVLSHILSASNNYGREVNRFELEVVYYDAPYLKKGDKVVWESTSSGSYILARNFAERERAEIGENGSPLDGFRQSYVIKRDTERLYTVFAVN